MKSLEIRSGDETLKNALSCWFEDFRHRLPGEGTIVISDLDSVPAAGIPNEITLSRSAPATLARPFSFEELEQAILLQPPKAPRLVFGEQSAFLDGRELFLSPLEDRLLRLLASQRRPMDKRELSLALWGEERASNQINVYIRYLRKKTDLEGKERLIHTLQGKGFYLKND
ncbi:MAG: winged helix-turn-helix transcriptional regulator [Clostridia bacterium]|nr:winged helix-turn-helix transcriptional regulator [Clostridia bacterium]